MKKLTFLKSLLMALCLLGGGTSAWAEDVTVGETDNSTAWWSAFSEYYTLAPNKTLTLNFTNYSDKVENFHNWLAVVTTDADRGATGYSEYLVLRADNYGWGGLYASGTLTSNYNWGTFKDDMDGSNVVLTVERRGAQVTVNADITASDGETKYFENFVFNCGLGTQTIRAFMTTEKGHLAIHSATISDTEGAFFATLEHTAGAQWGSNTGASTVDAEKEHYNSDAANSWAGCAYAKFSFSIPGGHSITGATLTYSVKQGGNYGRDDIIYYMAKDFDLDWTTFAEQTGKDLRYTANRAGKAVEAAPTGGKGDRLNLVQDITTAVSAIAAEGQNYIVLQWTGNAGGADLYGKASDNAPVLLITTSNVTLYTATFTETNSLAPTVTIYSDSERTAEVTNGTLLSGNTYYYTATLEGYNDYQGSFTVSGTDPTVEYTMTAKTVYTCTVNAKAGELLLASPNSSVYEGESTTVYYQKAYANAGKWYFVERNSVAPGYGVQFSNVASNMTIDVTTYALAENVVYFAETENLSINGSWATNGTYPTWRSNGMDKRLTANSYIYTDPIAAGVYDVTLFVRNKRSAGEGTETLALFLRDGEGNLADLGTSFPGWSRGGYEAENTATITIPADGKSYSIVINNNTSYNSNLEMDYVYVQKKTVSATIASSGYSTIASSYALDCANLPSGLKAYKVTDVTKTAVNLEEVSKAVQAGTGLILEGAPRETYSIPVAVSGSDISSTNKLKAAVTATDVAANEAYILQDGQFHLVTEASTVPAGKAYLLATDVPANVRALDMVVDGDADGISAIDNAQSTGNAMFDLSGRRVVKAQKGIYIVNGKKVVK